MLDYIDKKYSMRKTLMCGAMKPVSLLFDQPTYITDLVRQCSLELKLLFIFKIMITWTSWLVMSFLVYEMLNINIIDHMLLLAHLSR